MADDCGTLQIELQRVQNLLRKNPGDPTLLSEEKDLIRRMADCGLSLGAWRMNANGFLATLSIAALSTDGTVTGVFTDSGGAITLTNARWNQSLKQLSFRRSLRNGENQDFVGYLFDGPAAEPATLAGTFSADRFEGRPNFGWFAQHE
jgi:hypothetical protein